MGVLHTGGCPMLRTLWHTQWAGMLAPPALRRGLTQHLYSAPTPCQGVTFGVFGLGNRQYEHFCAMGKKVSNAMKVGWQGDEGQNAKQVQCSLHSWLLATPGAALYGCGGMRMLAGSPRNGAGRKDIWLMPPYTHAPMLAVAGRLGAAAPRRGRRRPRH